MSTFQANQILFRFLVHGFGLLTVITGQDAVDRSASIFLRSTGVSPVLMSSVPPTG